MSPNDTEITLYGTTWCGSSRRARQMLDEHAIPYHWVDVDADEAGARTLEGICGGCRSVPTLVWADGTTLIEPSQEDLAKKLGITLS